MDEAGLAAMSLDEFVVRYGDYEMSSCTEQLEKSKVDDNSGHVSVVQGVNTDY